MLENLQPPALLTIVELGGPMVLGLVLWYRIERARRLRRSLLEAVSRATQQLYGRPPEPHPLERRYMTNLSGREGA
jgi:hypothetical protein